MVDQGSIVQRRDSQVRRAPSASGLYDVLDLILDKGIVIDAFVRVSLVGIELLTVDLRVVVASVDTYLRYAEGVERLQLYNRSGSTRLPDMIGKTQKGKAIGRNVDKVTDALTDNGRRGDGDEEDNDSNAGEHEHKHGGLVETVSRGVRNTVGRLVDTVTGGDDDDDANGGRRDQGRRERDGDRDRDRPHRREHAAHRHDGHGRRPKAPAGR